MHFAVLHSDGCISSISKKVRSTFLEICETTVTHSGRLVAVVPFAGQRLGQRAVGHVLSMCISAINTNKQSERVRYVFAKPPTYRGEFDGLGNWGL